MSEMKSIEVDDASDDQLDWLVMAHEMKIAGNRMTPTAADSAGYKVTLIKTLADTIIDREGISTVYCGLYKEKPSWIAWGKDTPEGDRNPDGLAETRIKAAMKAHVVVNYGEEAFVPKELN